MYCKKSFFLTVFLSFIIISNLFGSKKTVKAVTIVPVADLLLQKYSILNPNKKVESNYKNIPLEGRKTSSISCPRVHQLLFNEQINIIDEYKNEVLIEIPQLFYISHKNKTKKQNRYWSHKKNFVTLNKLKTKKLNCKYLPSPIDFSKKNELINNVITILFPFKNKKTNITYSAGTRFIITKDKPQKKFVTVYILTNKPFKFEKVSIPKKICLLKQPNGNTFKRKQFISLLKKWANLNHGFIPYVWGGCSFTKNYTKNEFYKKNMIIEKNKKISIFSLKKQNQIVTGFDCTGMVARAAQIFNIPYFFKNSFTVAQNLLPIKKYKNLKNGDLLYFNGHIAVISDISQNKILEARGHSSGFGKIQEIKLNKMFKKIKTYKDLFIAYKTKKDLYRLNSNEDIYETIKNIKILKIL